MKSDQFRKIRGFASYLSSGYKQPSWENVQNEKKKCAPFFANMKQNQKDSFKISYLHIKSSSQLFGIFVFFSHFRGILLDFQRDFEKIGDFPGNHRF